MTDLIPRESEGPDRYRGSVRCREFHDLPNTDLGGTYQCCCCDPCRYLRPNHHLKLFADWGWCCRCVPRVIFVRFVPDDPDSPCCQPGGVPLFYNHDFAESLPKYYGTYAESIYGILVRVDLGAIDESDGLYETGTGTATYDCAWRIRVWDMRVLPSVKLSDTIIEIDHEAVTCIDVPNVTLVEGVTGPTGCTGSLVLEDVQKIRLPFVERGDTMQFNDHRDPRNDPRCQGDAAGTGTGTGTGSYEYGQAPADCQPEFINLCGECNPDYTTLTGLSVNGVLYLVDVYKNDRPTFVNSNRAVYWTGARWSLVENSATGTGDFDLDSAEEIATGPPLPDCPIGLWKWVEIGTGTGTGTSSEDRTCFCVTDPNDSTVHTPCGCCGQVCSRICVERVFPDDFSLNRRDTFIWFENWYGDLLLSRGWEYDNPATGYTERVLFGETHLIDVNGTTFELDTEPHAFGDPNRPYWHGYILGADMYVYYTAAGTQWAIMRDGNEAALGPVDPTSPYGYYPGTISPFTNYTVSEVAESVDQCSVRLRYGADADEVTDPVYVDIERGCSCKFYANLGGGGPEGAVWAATARCGFCTCWDFYCGKCRCAPAELCVALYLAGTWYPNTQLVWDDELRGWTGTGTEETGTEVTGTGTIEVIVLLQRDDQGRCVLVPEVPGHTFPEEFQYPIWNCGREAIDRVVDSAYIGDFISFYIEDASDPNNILMMAGASLTPDCGRGNCDEATPCYQECGTHPSILHMTLSQYRIPGDQSIEDDPGESWSTTILLAYQQTVDYYTAGDPAETSEVKYSCWYTGYLPGMGTCCPIRVELRSGHIEFTPLPDGSCTPVGATGFVNLTTETCDPYYGTTGEIGPTASIFTGQCLGFVIGDATRWEAVITE